MPRSPCRQGVQYMVRSDLGAAGVMFTLDTESGFPDVVFITSSYGLGELVVQGAVNPDEFYVHKAMLKAGKFAVIRRSLGSKLQRMSFAAPAERARTGALVTTTETPLVDRNQFSLSDADVLELARYAVLIEQHYGRPMDIEWGKDGSDNRLYILQARPETVKSQAGNQVELRYKLKDTGAVLAEGRAIGQKIGSGPARLVKGIADMDQRPGRRRAGDRHDGSELGAGHEARQRHRDQPGWPHLSRRHHRARTGHSGGGGLRGCDAPHCRRHRGHRRVFRRRYRAMCTKAGSRPKSAKCAGARCPPAASRS